MKEDLFALFFRKNGFFSLLGVGYSKDESIEEIMEAASEFLKIPKNKLEFSPIPFFPALINRASKKILVEKKRGHFCFTLVAM